MSNIFLKLFGCTNREKKAEEAQRQGQEIHEEAMKEMNKQVWQAKRAAAESRSAVKSLLHKLSEDIPK